MPRPIKGNGRYMAGLDGVRALAVLAVIAYHLNVSWSPGGLLGVGVFFVLSGYLITDLLAKGQNRSGKLDMKDFWLRRARRLLPALLLMLLVVMAWITLVDRSRVLSLREDVLAAVFYVSNWWFIFHHVSYFASFGPPSPLGHLWSLAVEEQFYLLWPLLLTLGFRYVKKRGYLILFTLVGAVASAIVMAMLFQPGTDPSRVYYGTDTRVFALLIGAALALVWPSQKLAKTVSPLSRLTLDLIGFVGLLIVLAMIRRTSEYDAFLYQGGLVLLSVATAMLIAALAHPASRLSLLVGCKPLRWLGVRSYGIYLWHYPVIVLTSKSVDTGGFDVRRAILQIAVSILLAALSWRYVEEPIRQGAIGKLWAQFRAKELRWRLVFGKWGSVSTCLVVIFGLCCLGVSCFGLVAPIPAETISIPNFASAVSTEPNSSGDTKTFTTTKPNADTPSEKTSFSPEVAPPRNPRVMPTPTPPPKVDASKTISAPKPSVDSSGNAGTSAPSADTPKNTDSTTGSTSPIADPPKPPDNQTPQPGQGITAIGDSVMVDVAPYLQKLLPGIVVDAKVGRQLYQTQPVVEDLKAKGQLGKIVILELGTNGPFTKEQLVSLLNSLGPVQEIVLVNSRVPRPWQDEVNATLAEVAATFPHTKLVNWYAASAGKDSYFYPDGVHPNPEGSQFYASLVSKAVTR